MSFRHLKKKSKFLKCNRGVLCLSKNWTINTRRKIRPYQPSIATHDEKLHKYFSLIVDWRFLVVNLGELATNNFQLMIREDLFVHVLVMS